MDSDEPALAGVLPRWCADNGLPPELAELRDRLNPRCSTSGLDPALAFGPSYFMRTSSPTRQRCDGCGAASCGRCCVEHHYADDDALESYRFDEWCDELGLTAQPAKDDERSRSDLASLSEGQVVHGVDLTRAEAVALNATRLVSVAPAADGWTVTAAYAVGALRCGDLDVRVQPKVGAVQVLRLLARAQGVKDLKLDEHDVEVAADADLTTVLAIFFAQEAASAMAAGPLRGYRTEDQTLPVVRGRLRIRDQELRRFGQLAPLEVTRRRVDHRHRREPDDPRRHPPAARSSSPAGPGTTSARAPRPAARRRATAAHAAAHSPDPNAHGSTHGCTTCWRWPSWSWPLGQSSTRVGEVAVRGFVLSMPLLFERLVGRLLSEMREPWRVVEQRRKSLDVGGRLTIKPDLTLLQRGKAVAVADLKYKLLDESGAFPNADAYQLIAYCSRLGLSVGHLIYAAGEPCPEPYDIRGADVRLIVHAIDLGATMDDLENQVAAVATKMGSTALNESQMSVMG